MINIAKIMVDDCERFVNSLRRFYDLESELTNDELDDIIATFTDSEIELYNELSYRYENNLSIIDKLK